MQYRDIYEARGPLSGRTICNTGKLGKLEDALTLWIEGEVTAAQPSLLALADVAAEFHGYPPDELIRAITLPNPDYKYMSVAGLTVTRREGKMLESWSVDEDAVCDYMSTYAPDWIAIRAGGHDVFIDLVDFNDEARPSRDMGYQGEVIVKAPPSRHFTPDQLWVSKFVVQHHDLAPLDNFDRMPELNPINSYRWR